MKKRILILGLLIVGMAKVLCAATRTYYFEAEHAQTRKKMYFLGTNHLLPASILPDAVRKHIKTRHGVINEQGNVGGKNKKVNPLTVRGWQSGNYFRFPTDTRDAFAELTPNQRNNLLKVVGVVFPDLAKGTASVKLNDFTAMGLRSLFYECLQDVGMDKGVCEMLKSTGLPSLDDDGACFVLAHRGKMKLAASKLKRISDFIASGGRYDADQEFWDSLETGNIYYMPKFDSIISHVLDSPTTFTELYNHGCEEELITREYLESDMIKGRNQVWLPKIFKYNSKGWDIDLFVMGAGHIFGEHGILQMMQRKGFNIRRATPSAKFMPYLHALGSDGKPLLSFQEKASLGVSQAKLALANAQGVQAKRKAALGVQRAKLRANWFMAQHELARVKEDAKYKVLKAWDAYWESAHNPKNRKKRTQATIKAADLKRAQSKAKIQSMIRAAENRVKMASQKLKKAG